MNYMLAFLLVCFAAFCAFGFLASFEPGDFMVSRTVYGVLFVGAVLGALRLFLTSGDVLGDDLLEIIDGEEVDPVEVAGGYASTSHRRIVEAFVRMLRIDGYDEIQSAVGSDDLFEPGRSCGVVGRRKYPQFFRGTETVPAGTEAVNHQRCEGEGDPAKKHAPIVNVVPVEFQ